MKKYNPKIATMLGTMLEYYDMSLYGMLMPILVEVFLPQYDKITALLFTSLMLPVTLLARPIGAIFIGRIGDKKGRKNALVISISGMAIVTFATGLLPSYQVTGIYAPIMFFVLRISQGFFVAGEYNGGAVFILEHSSKKQYGFMSGLYCFFTVIGITAAAGISSIVSHFPTSYWRIPYLIGGLIGLYALFLRRKLSESPEFVRAANSENVKLSEILVQKSKIIRCIIVATFFSALYVLPTIFFNAFIPIVTEFPISTILTINSFTTIIYMISLPLMGHFSDKYQFSSMRVACVTVAILCYPLISLIQTKNLYLIIIMKVVFAILTAWYVGPFHAWIFNKFKTKERYTATSFCYSIGSQLGNLITPFSFWAWQNSHSYFIISLPILVLAVAANLSIKYEEPSQQT